MKLTLTSEMIERLPDIISAIRIAEPGLTYAVKTYDTANAHRIWRQQYERE